jgi:plastocyanin
MSSIRFLGIGFLALVFLGGCESTPTVTRTGVVKDIVIGDKPFAVEVSVNPGDEVRWVNKRTEPARIVFLNPISAKQLSCKNNFGGVLTPSSTGELATNQTASACFQNPGYYPYVVSVESASDGQINVAGVVTVGEPSTDQTSDSNNIAQSRGEAGRIDGQPTDEKSGPASSTSTTTTATTTLAM